MNGKKQTAIVAALKEAISQLQNGCLYEAEKILLNIVAKEPKQIDALHYLARVAHDRGDNREALAWLDRAIAAMPENPALHNSRGILLNAMGRLEEAVTALHQALQYCIDYYEAHYNLAMVYCSLGKYEESCRYFRRAMILRSDDWRGCFEFGERLSRCHQHAAAMEFFQEALRIKPNFPQAWNSLGRSLRNLGRLKEAEEAYRKALCLQPDYAVAHSALLSMLGYHVLASPLQTLAEHQAWDRVHGGAEKLKTFRHRRSRAIGRRKLRVGYVSPDFYRHAVSSFIDPILEHHDRNQVEVYCYAEVHNPDEVTVRLQKKTDVWRSTVGLDDKAVAQMIYEDGIDVLVDLAGHSHADRTRIKVFTYKPAPVQVTYLGYFTTTGLQAMDYWITDKVTCPVETTELAVEKIYRLPRCCVSYSPIQDAPPVIDRPTVSDAVTFGCFNNLGKVSPSAIAYWSQILNKLPASRLVLKAGQLADPIMREKIVEQFAQHGVAAERLTLLPYTATQREHFALHGEIDIALDTMPRTGVTTTADALWMGVPVITLAGERFIERLGASLLHSVGLNELIADSPKAYVAKAVTLAQNEERRREMRRNLRQRMLDSPLCDGRDLAQALEEAYRHMYWETAAM